MYITPKRSSQTKPFEKPNVAKFLMLVGSRLIPLANAKERKRKSLFYIARCTLIHVDGGRLARKKHQAERSRRGLTTPTRLRSKLGNLTLLSHTGATRDLHE